MCSVKSEPFYFHRYMSRRLQFGPVKLFANMGFTPEMIWPSIRRRPDLESIFLFHGSEPPTKKALEVVQAEAKKFDVPVRKMLIDVFDPTIAFSAYLKQFKGLPVPRDVVFNMAGGTGIVTAAATAFCSALRVPMVYVRRDTLEEIELPRSLFGYRYRFLDSHTQVLGAIRDGNAQVKTLDKAMRLSQGRISVLVQELEEGGYLRSRREGREKFLELTPFAQIVLDAQELVAEQAPAR